MSVVLLLPPLPAEPELDEEVGIPVVVGVDPVGFPVLELPAAPLDILVDELPVELPVAGGSEEKPQVTTATAAALHKRGSSSVDQPRSDPRFVTMRPPKSNQLQRKKSLADTCRQYVSTTGSFW